jgi:hypothetical protein
MDHRQIVLGFMAQVAKVLARCLQLEVRFQRFCRVLGVAVGMAHHALTDAHRPMNELGFPHTGMALRSDTLLRACLCRHPEQNQHGDGKNDNGDPPIAFHDALQLRK